MAVLDVPAESREALELQGTAALCLDSAWLRAVVANPNEPYETVKAWAVGASGVDIEAGRADAAAKVVYLLIDEEEHGDAPSAAPPRILLCHEGEQVAQRNGGDDFTQRAEISVILELRIPDCYRDGTVEGAARATFHATNIMGKFREDLRADRGLGGRLYADEVILEACGFADPKRCGGEVLYIAQFLLRAQGT